MRTVVRAVSIVFIAVGVTAISAARTPLAGAAQNGAGANGNSAVPAAGIGGTVVNAATGRPEAGVWVIAETRLQTPYKKIVVTDDQGRFLVLDLPQASYDVWVRGYGLKDSAKSKAERGQQLKLQASNATPQEASRLHRLRTRSGRSIRERER